MIRHINDDSILLLVTTNDGIYHGVIISSRIVVVSQTGQLCPIQVWTVVVGRSELPSLFGETSYIIYMLSHEVVDGEG